MEVQDGREGGVTGPAPGDGRGGATSLSQPAGLPHNRVQWRRWPTLKIERVAPMTDVGAAGRTALHGHAASGGGAPCI